MKALKIFATIVVVIAVLIAALVGIALLPSVQTWAVKKAVAGQPDLKLEVGRVAAGFSSADLQDVHLVKGAIVVTAKRASAKYSAWDYVFHRRVNVSDLTVDDLLIDTRSLAASTTAATPPKPSEIKAAEPKPASSKSQGSTFNGLLNEAKLPFDLQIARFSIPGRALLPNQQTATFELVGNNITTGQRGTLDWKADLSSEAPKATIHVIRTAGSAAVHITNERRIDLVEINGTLSAEGTGIPSDAIKLEAKAEQPTLGGNEGYNARVLLAHGNTAQPLLTIAGQFDASSHEVTGAWTATVRTEQVQALLSGLGLPDFAINGAGKFSAKPDRGSIAANGDLDGTVTQLEKVSPEFASIGKIRLRAKFDGGVADNVARITQFALNVAGANGQDITDIEVGQQIGFSLTDQKVTLADPKAELAHVIVQSLPLAWIQPFLKGMIVDNGDVSLRLSVTADADGSHVHITAPEPITLRNVTIRNGADKLTDQLTLRLTPDVEYSPDRVQAKITEINGTMPTGDELKGNITADITNLKADRTISFTADTEAKVVAALKPYLPAEVGSLTVVSHSQGKLAGQSLRFDRSSVSVTNPGAGQIVNFDLIQALTVNLQNNSFATDKPDAPAARVRLAHVPLAWANKFVPGGQFSGEVTGGTLDVGLRSVDDLAATTAEPLAVRGMSAEMNGQPMLQNVDATIDLKASKHGATISYDVRRFEAKAGNTLLATVTSSGELTTQPKLTIHAKGSVDADAAALMQQPVAAVASLAAGKVNVTFDANIADAIQANAKVTARGLVAKQQNRPLGDAELTLTAAVQPDGSSVLKMPFTLTTGGRKSDLSIDGKLTRTVKAIAFEGQITSNQLFVEDLQPLAGLAPTTKTAPGSGTSGNAPQPRTNVSSPPGSIPVGSTSGTLSPSPATATRDAQPFWTGLGGKLDVDLKQITVSRDYVVSGVRGGATITATHLGINSLEGQLKENPFKISATIDFDEKKAQPYTLASAATFSNVDIGELLRAANPNEKPQLETKVSVAAKIDGEGATAADLLQRASGKFDVTGSPGVLRALAKKGGAAASGLAAGLSMLGAAQQSEGTVALGQLTQKLAELPFDKFVMHAERGTDLNIKVTQLDFVSADTRVSGTGMITNQPGVSIQNQPMQFTVQLAGKESMAVIMDRAHILSDQRDALGYQNMFTTFNLRGTPAKADSSDLWRVLAQTAVRNFGDQIGNGLQRLLGH